MIGTASEGSFAALQDLGTDQIIDYKQESLEDKLTEKVDVIFNLAPLASDEVTQLLSVLKQGGTLVSALNPADESVAREQGIHTVRMAVQRNAQQLSRIAEIVDHGHIKPVITERLPLSDLAAAHEKNGQTRGKVLILVNARQ